jgi:hypothetical protein
VFCKYFANGCPTKGLLGDVILDEIESTNYSFPTLDEIEKRGVKDRTVPAWPVVRELYCRKDFMDCPMFKKLDKNKMSKDEYEKMLDEYGYFTD